ncbi:MAG: nucleoside triphosphate pyrophosphohydrolase [Chloroflexi bacterium]|nr:nucleoside triphosphate pyrophosphohydrolase [Chloroflexota bacterium]
MTARGDQLAVESLIATARAVAPHVDLAGGFAVIPLRAIASTAADPRLPLFVTRTVAPKEARAVAGVELPGRGGSGAALLERLYGAQHQVTLLPSGETTTLQSVTADTSNAWEALLLPPLAPIEALASPWAMPWLSARLRAPDGCPWDREQTHLTLAKHLIEEAWELHDAIEAQAAAPSAATDAAIAEELGDVYLQVVLHTQLAAERGAFDLTDVQERLAKKIIRRHPHVFGEATAETSREVQRAWESVKAEERAERGDASPKSKSALSGVSRGLPALSASRELQDRASAMGYDWPTLDGVREKFTEEIQELTEALEAAGNPDSITGRGATSAATLAAAQDELGDVMAVLVNLGRRSGIDAEAALRGANEKFRRRFGEVERRAAERKIDLKTADFATLDTLWDEAKAAERAGALDSKS